MWIILAIIGLIALAALAVIILRAPTIHCSNPECGGCGGSCPTKSYDSREDRP